MKKISKMKSTKLGSNGSSSSAIQAPISSMANGKAKGIGSVPGSHSQSTGLSTQQDELNLKVIRDLCHVESNRFCFDCGQRGPTYVNITIGSFICMQCSGLLRGLTPPHRVKSISMANFTSDEIELLKNRGNEYCRKVWLATYTSKDTQLMSSTDSDRVNALKSLLSSKYEVKRYYVDPSKLSRTELSEIQGKNLNAMSGSSNNGSSIQKSPTSTHSEPSPVLNNLRSSFSSLHEKGKARIPNSMTLPDIKPLSSLDPSLTLNGNVSTLSLSSTSSSASSGLNFNGTNNGGSKVMNGHVVPVPINFINNLVSTTNGIYPSNNNKQNSNNNQFQLPSSWESVTAPEIINGNNGSENFTQNFADFEDAFNNTNNGSGTNGIISSNGLNHGLINGNSNNNGLSQKLINGGFQGSGNIHVPLLPHHHGNGEISNILTNGVHTNGLMGNNTNNDTNGDKYAALKDLDSLFKNQGEGIGSGSGSSLETTTLSASMSVPTNLSTCSGKNIDWFSTSSSPTQQNPFSQVNEHSFTPNRGGDNNNGLFNGCGLTHNNSGNNPHNPFYNPNAWGSSTMLPNGGNYTFPSPGSSSTNGNHLNPSHQNFIRNDQPVKTFNPFFHQQTPQPQHTSNPNNPFL